MWLFRRPRTRAWLAAPVCIGLCFTTPPAAARTWEQVRDVGAISVCANPDALPYSSNRADEPGFQIEIARAIAQGLGVPLAIDWIVPRRRVTEVNCDMLLDSINDPDLHLKDRLLSIPYQRTGVALALGSNTDGVNSLRDLGSGQKVGVMTNSLAGVELGRRGVSISPYAFQSSMLEDVENGQLFGAVVSAATLSYYLKRHPQGRVRMVDLIDSDPELAWTVSVALRHADQALLTRVNALIASLSTNGTIARIYAKYGVDYRAPASQAEPH